MSGLLVRAALDARIGGKLRQHFDVATIGWSEGDRAAFEVLRRGLDFDERPAVIENDRSARHREHVVGARG